MIGEYLKVIDCTEQYGRLLPEERQQRKILDV